MDVKYWSSFPKRSKEHWTAFLRRTNCKNWVPLLILLLQIIFSFAFPRWGRDPEVALVPGFFMWFCFQKTEETSIYPQHLWESQPSYMERRDLFAPCGMEITVLSAAWKTLPNVTYANKMAFEMPNTKCMCVCEYLYTYKHIWLAHVCVWVHTHARVCACLCVLRMLGKWWIITA